MGYSVSNGIYAGISLAVVLFFTTGSFLSYLPSKAKPAKKLDFSVLNGIAQTGRVSFKSATDLRHSMLKCMSESEVMKATGSGRLVGLPKLMSKVDSFNHHKALEAIGSTASLLGLDKTEVEGVAEDRLLH